MIYGNEQTYSSSVSRDRSLIKNVYLWMTAGLALTGVVSFGMSSNQSLMIAFISNQVLFFGTIIAELALVMYLSARIQKMSTTSATLAFALYAF